MITPNGLGIINSEGRLIKFSGAGLFESFSPSGMQIVYQHGFEDDFGDYIDNLFVYNASIGRTVEILDDLKYEGRKEVIAWSQNEQKFIYSNDYLAVLFEAYGYFGPSQLLLADVTTGKVTLLIEDGYQFDVSPDQSQIAYTTGELLDFKTKQPDKTPIDPFGCFHPHIFNMKSSSSHSLDISQLSKRPVCLGYPKWSPDGQKIAWIGYFNDETFRPVIFNLQNGAGIIYDALKQKPERSVVPTRWRFGERSSGGLFDPEWVDNSTFWTPSYEVNIATGKSSEPRQLNSPYNPRRDHNLQSPNGLFGVSLNEERDTIKLSDLNGNTISSFLLDELYDGQRFEILKNGLFLFGRTDVVGWSPFVPPSNIVNN